MPRGLESRIGHLQINGADSGMFKKLTDNTVYLSSEEKTGLKAVEVSPTTIISAQGGTQDAWVEIFQTYQTRLFRWFQKKGVHIDDAEDCTQEVWYRAARSLHTRYEVQGVPLSHYLFGSARWVLVDFFNGKKREMVKEGNGDFVNLISQHPFDHPEEFVEQEEGIREFDNHIAGLPENQAFVLRLKYVSDWAPNDIAGHLGIPAKNVYKASREGHRRLKRKQNKETRKLAEQTSR